MGNENEVMTKNGSSFASLPSINAANSQDSDFAGLEFSLDRIKFPTGGATSFLVPGLNGDEEVKEVEGVIIYQHPAFSYYKDKYSGQTNPPDCFSIDGVKGEGTPGGDCKKCPYNQFTKKDDGTSNKDCKNKRALYIQTLNQIIPFTMYVPVGSMGAYRQFAQGLMAKNKKPSEIVTKITLKKETNKGGIPYSQAVFTFVRDLTKDEITKLMDVRAFVSDYSKQRMMNIITESASDDSFQEATKDPVK